MELARRIQGRSSGARDFDATHLIQLEDILPNPRRKTNRQLFWDRAHTHNTDLDPPRATPHGIFLAAITPRCVTPEITQAPSATAL